MFPSLCSRSMYARKTRSLGACAESEKGERERENKKGEMERETERERVRDSNVLFREQHRKFCELLGGSFDESEDKKSAKIISDHFPLFQTSNSAYKIHIFEKENF
jgi:hypothetical protein